MAAQSKQGEFVDLTKSLISEVNAPDAPICFATLDDGATQLYSSDDATAVQHAVDAASSGDKVKVAGTCVGVQLRDGLTQTVYISKSITLEGGYTESDWTLEPDLKTYTTTLDANHGGRVVVISGTVDVKLDSILFTGGRGYPDIGSITNPAGGIYSNGSLTLTNSIVYSNTAFNGGGLFSDEGSELFIKNGTFMNNIAQFGGGLAASSISPTLDSVEFIGNQVGGDYGWGGGVFAFGGNWMINNVYFAGNAAINGGGFYSYGADTKTTNAIFINNTTPGCGGGLLNYLNQSVMTNTLFSGNKAKRGGGICNGTNKSILFNTTLSGNYAAEDGGGIYSEDINESYVYNSINWNNHDSSGTGTISATIYLTESAKITITNSIVEASGGSGSWILDTAKYIDGGFNKDTDPLFVSPVDPATAPTADGNLRLTDNSPAIDMGNNAFISIIYDLDRNGRIADGDDNGTATVDMGAYEFLKYIVNLPLISR